MKPKLLNIIVMYVIVILLFSLLPGCQKELTSNNSRQKPVNSTSNIAINQEALAALGKHIFFDKISSPNNMSCADCHAPEYGFTGPNSGINIAGGVYRGAIAKRFGNRRPPSAAYATTSPIFHLEEAEEDELFEGGNFWDGRATGEHLGNPAADQALGPFLNPVEQNVSGKAEVLKQIAASKYAGDWMKVWNEPIDYSPEKVNQNYDRVGLAIAAYEGSPEVNQFSSKYDAFLQGKASLTPLEANGLSLFNGKGKCALCHPSEGEQPLFTDYTFDNLGVPRNPDNPFYTMDNVFLDGGSPINPMGASWIDPGLGGFLENHPNALWRSMAAINWGKQKVPTLRNVDKRPGPGNAKAYMHNGVFKTLEEVVHFYNTRDVASWPPPEVAQNVNITELGNLQLTPAEEKAIVAFLKTLSDGYLK